MDFKEIVSLQYDLNEKLAGKDWLDNPRVNYRNAAFDEVYELQKSLGWQAWWVKGEAKVDLENAKLEVVDLLHFHVSGIIKDKHAELLGLGKESSKDELINLASIILQDSYSHFTGKGVHYEVTPLDYIADAVNLGFDNASTDLFLISEQVGLTLDSLFSFYLAKHTLNRFRNDNNYKGDKEGLPPYIKLWQDGKEDNFYLMQHVQSMLDTKTPVDTDLLYSWLGYTYTQFLKNAIWKTL